MTYIQYREQLQAAKTVNPRSRLPSATIQLRKLKHTAKRRRNVHPGQCLSLRWERSGGGGITTHSHSAATRLVGHATSIQYVHSASYFSPSSQKRLEEPEWLGSARRSVSARRPLCKVKEQDVDPIFSAGVKDNSEMHDGTSEADCGDDQTKTLWPSGGLEPAH